MFFEALESRRLLTSAPPTVLGISANVTITSGTVPLATSGTFELSIGTNARDYKIVGDGTSVADSEGTYSYRVVQPKVGELKLTDATIGELTARFTFATPTTGTVAAVRAAGGSLTGTFAISGPDFAFVQGKVLVVPGTTDGDAIGISLAHDHDVSGLPHKHDVSVTRNNITQDFHEFEGISVIVNADAGNDLVDTTTMSYPTYIDAGAGNDSVSTGDQNDTLTGGAGRNTLAGNDGDDRVQGSGASDLLFGGAGADRLYGNGGNDTLDGGGGVDRLFGGDGNDSLIGASSNDKLYGEAGDDTLIGGKGEDLLTGADGKDVLVQ